MAIDKVKAYFAQFGMEERVMEAATSSATVEEAAATLGCGPERIAKTLSFRTDTDVILDVYKRQILLDALHQLQIDGAVIGQIQWHTIHLTSSIIVLPV